MGINGTDIAKSNDLQLKIEILHVILYFSRY
jgi:hypothetical protein